MSSNETLNSPKIELADDGVYFCHDNGEKQRIAAPIQIAAFAKSDPETPREKAHIDVHFVDWDGKAKEVILPAAMLSSHKNEFITRLSDACYLWPSDSRLQLKMIGALANQRPSKRNLITYVTGWHGDTFVLPYGNCGPNGESREGIRLESHPTVLLGEFRRCGNLSIWRKRVAKVGQDSTRIRLAIASAFAAPNLRPLGIDSFGLNFSGETSSGKTFCIRAAASVPGLNSDAGPTSWDGSATGFEQRALGHRDCVVSFDDTSNLPPSDIAKLVTFRLAGNRPKTRAGQYVAAHNLVESDWRIIALSTSEDPMWGQGSRRIRGEEVRMINIPACVSDKRDIFDGAHADSRVGSSLDERLRYIDRLNKFAKDYQGEAFWEYCLRRAADESALENLKAYMSQFQAATPVPTELRWAGRIRRSFEVVYASAAQAIDYGILPWKKKPTLVAIKACFDDAISQRVDGHAGHPNVADDDLLAEFWRRVAGANFVRVGRGRVQRPTADQLNVADGFTRPTQPGRVQHLLRSDRLEAWFPVAAERKRLTAMLLAGGMVRRGRRKDSTTRQVKLSPIGKVSCYLLVRNRIVAASTSD